MTLLLLLVHKTNLGRAMRAVSESPANASLMGISVDKIIRLTFMLGAALAGIAGVLIALNYNFVHFTMAFYQIEGLYRRSSGWHWKYCRGFVRWSAFGIIESLGAGYIGDLTMVSGQSLSRYFLVCNSNCCALI